VSRDEHNVRVMFEGNLALQIQAVDVRELHVQDEARRQLGLRKREVFGGGSERDDISYPRT